MAKSAYPPLELLNRVTEEYPEAWDKMKMFHGMNGTAELPKWKSWCYAPMAAAMAVALNEKPGTYENIAGVVQATQQIAALAPWNENRDVFVFSESSQEELFESAENLSLGSRLLYHLPYQAFYIQFSKEFSYLDMPCHGVFVHLEDDVNSGDHELRLLYLSPSGRTIGVPIHIGDETLEDSMNHTLHEAWKNATDDHPDVRRALIRPLEDREQEISEQRKTLQFVAYLCKQNVENGTGSAFLNAKLSDGGIHIHVL